MSAQENEPFKTSVISGEKRVSQWEVLMRKFSEAHKEECKYGEVTLISRLSCEKQTKLINVLVGSWADEFNCANMSAQENEPFKTSVISGEKRVSQWEVLMRKFSEAHKEECKSVTLDIPRVRRAEKTFPTGSSYTGTWDVLGMSGQGTYKLPNGVIYEGEFDDGTFHGRGELRYPCGAVIFGRWERGEMVERTLVFPDGLQYAEEDWPYCTMPDRRFSIEIDNGLKPAGRSYLTADQPTRDIPPGFYDTCDGFFDPDAKIVLSDDLTHIIRKPCPLEQKWIMDNCRHNPMGPLGPRPDLYEEWSEPKTEPDTVKDIASAKQGIFAFSKSKTHLVVEDKDSDTAFPHLRGDSTSTSSFSN